jgi:uncharacterized protein YndB with AHSA1/START domain
MTDADTGVVEQTVRIQARPETVWRFWTDPQRICDWWGETAQLDPRPGGTYRVEMGGGPTMSGEYLELVPFERIVFSFGWEAMEGGGPHVAPGSTRVEVTFTPADGDTIMTLRHSGLPAADAEEHQVGWARFLPRLTAAIDRAIAGRSGR